MSLCPVDQQPLTSTSFMTIWSGLDSGITFGLDTVFESIFDALFDGI